VLRQPARPPAAIARGALVYVVLASANHDKRQFENPDRLDITRQNNRHLAFGQGIHYCLGAPLARLEAQISINALLRRSPHLQLAAPASEIPLEEGIGAARTEIVAGKVLATKPGHLILGALVTFASEKPRRKRVNPTANAGTGFSNDSRICACSCARFAASSSPECGRGKPYCNRRSVLQFRFVTLYGSKFRVPS
jgi:hypothetical protein